jgi:hypothetical protein
VSTVADDRVRSTGQRGSRFGSCCGLQQPVELVAEDAIVPPRSALEARSVDGDHLGPAVAHEPGVRQRTSSESDRNATRDEHLHG